MLNNVVLDIFAKHNLMLGRLISYSKTAPPEHQVIWNANVVSENQGKVWYGDLSLVKDIDKLQAIANDMGDSLYVLKEADCRFEKENASIEFLKSQALWMIKPK